MQTWITKWINHWTSPELKLIRRIPQGNASLVTWIDILTLAAADHCDGELFAAPGVPHTMETIAARLNRDVIWFRNAVEPLLSVGLLHWRTGSPPVLVITHWDGEHE